jgi:hypothetical protein
MRLTRVWLWIGGALLTASATASAQSTTGTISGRVIDTQERAMPGVTVSIEGSSLQGARTVVTSDNGDYVIALLPPGRFTVTFELGGFQTQQRVVSLAPTQALPLDATMGPAAVSETVQVVGRAVDVLTQTAQVATNFSQSMVAALPTSRDINAAVLLAPSVHATGPHGAYSIAGSMSFENLFMVNGVTVNENLRGQPHDLYIEDAIQETTIATAGVSAEYGRFGGGVVNVVTKSGGNAFAGSFRDTLNNDKWRALTPFPSDSTADKVLPTYEYTLGGPVVRDGLWFFTAGRAQETEEARTLVTTNIPYTFSNTLRRYEGKAIYSLNSSHRIEGAYTRSTEDQKNVAQSTATAMDMNSLYDPQRQMDLFTLGYTAILSPAFSVESRVSMRNETIHDVGGTFTDLVRGTLLLDGSRSLRRYWAPTFCGVCAPEERDNQNIFVKGSYFLSSGASGAHHFVFGYDRFNDQRFVNNHQSASDYRIYGSSAIIDSGTITPVFQPGGSTVIQWNPIPVGPDGASANFRSHSLFLSDGWRVSPRLTANLGVRYDKNDGVNSAGQTVANDSAWSPRLGVIWDPLGDQRWSVTGSVARYVAGITNTIGNAGSPGGNPDTYPFVYNGPAINANGVVETPTAAAVQQVFDWFFANGGSNLPFNGGTYGVPVVVTGVTPLIRDSLTSPNALEYAGGVSRQFGARATLRADVVYRDYHDFYVQRTDTSTGQVADKLGRSFDLTLIENSDHLKRQYAGLSLQATYRLDSTLDVGGNYTLSRAWGNADGESANSGPSADASLQYPEYKQASWNYPEGDLSIDQRHRARLWAIYNVPRVRGLSMSVLQTLESGAPYGAVATSGVNPRAFVTNPGYLTPPGAVTYYLTDRDAFRTEGQRRTDFAANYVYSVPGLRRVQLFGQLQVINLFNESQLCGCGQAVFQNGGAVRLDRIDQTVSIVQAFNPFTTVPVEGTNWAKGPNFGKATSRLSYTLPRTARISFGVRF